MDFQAEYPARCSTLYNFSFAGIGHTRSCHTGDAAPICIESSRNHQTNCFCEGDLCNGANSSLSHVGITTMLVVAVSLSVRLRVGF